MSKYCGKCGEKLVKEQEEGFNVNTGKPKFRLICPVRKCGHTGTPHINVYPGIFGRMVTCARCDYSREMYDVI